MTTMLFHIPYFIAKSTDGNRHASAPATNYTKTECHAGYERRPSFLQKHFAAVLDLSPRAHWNRASNVSRDRSNATEWEKHANAR